MQLISFRYIPYYRSLLSAFILVILVFDTAAQTSALKNYGSADGLPSTETYCAIQDSRGYMWFSTDKGLVKFDGYTFKAFSTADGLPDNTIFGLFEDQEHRIWFKTYSSLTGYLKDDSIHV